MRWHEGFASVDGWLVGARPRACAIMGPVGEAGGVGGDVGSSRRVAGADVPAVERAAQPDRVRAVLGPAALLAAAWAGKLLGDRLVTGMGHAAGPAPLLTLLGWLPVGGFVVLVGLLLAAGARWPSRPRPLTWLARLLVAAWFGLTWNFFAGRSGWHRMEQHLGSAAPALAHSAEWTLLGGSAMFLLGLVAGVTPLGDRLGERSRPLWLLVVLVPGQLAVLLLLLVTSPA